MKTVPPPLALLGPQRHQPTLAATFDRLEIEGPIAAVTAGWQEREQEVEEMQEHLGRPVMNLRLYERAEEVFNADSRLFEHYRRRQEQLKALQNVYRVRLAHALAATRELMRRDGDRWLLGPERRAALQTLRNLDNRHLRRVRQIHESFREEARLEERPDLERHRREIAEELSRAGALAIAGGHVAVLLNRLRLFRLLELARGLPVVAWSAGAMVLGEKVVLFHDHPPQGPGDAEVLEHGLGLFRDVLPLPHANHRLRLGDSVRVSILARRFSPAVPTAFVPGSALIRGGTEGWQASPETRRLTSRGGVRPFERSSAGRKSEKKESGYGREEEQ